MNDHPEKDYMAASNSGSEAESTPLAEDADAEYQDDHRAFLRLAEENAELNDRLLRLAADMENLRKRTARDVQDARAYSISAFARDMLGVADNLRRALDAVPSEALDEDSRLKGLAEGVEITARDLLSALERHGVRKIDPMGSRFDPHFHQAMFEVENPDVAAGTVVEVMQEGYVIGERVLRPAMVGVSKGGAKATPEPAGSEGGA